MTDDELLDPRPLTSNDTLKANVLARTVRRVRWIVWRRRGLQSAVGFMCFGLGWVTANLRPGLVPEVVYVEVPVERSAPVADAPGSPAARKDEPPSPATTLTPAQLELAAEQIPEKAEAARRFREAGDRYLRESANYVAAIRCYRNFLDEADPADRAVSPDDTWLLTSLKRAREQESSQ